MMKEFIDSSQNLMFSEFKCPFPHFCKATHAEECLCSAFQQPLALLTPELMLFNWILYLCQPQKTNVTCHSNNADVTLLLLLPAKKAISMLPTENASFILASILNSLGNQGMAVKIPHPFS